MKLNNYQTRIDLCPSTWQLVQTSYQMWAPPPLFMHIKCTSHVFLVEHEVHFMHLCFYAYLNVNDLDRACSPSHARTLAYAMPHHIPANGLCFEHFVHLRAEPNSCFVFLQRLAYTVQIPFMSFLTFSSTLSSDPNTPHCEHKYAIDDLFSAWFTISIFNLVYSIVLICCHDVWLMLLMVLFMWTFE